MRGVRMRVRLLVAAAIVVAPVTHAAGAQMLPDTGAAGARTAQWRFEVFRRARLPMSFSEADPCDVRVGRFCYSTDEGDADGPLPEEPREIVRERAALIARLSASDSASPNGWVSGQLVRYLVEAGRDSDAVAAARHCGARGGGGGGGWWCDALLGYALHESGDDAAAGAAYDSALAAMPDSTRCHWSDISPWLEGQTAERFKALDCEGKAREARRVWWLARPLMAARESDDARVEFLARRTMAAVLAGSGSPFPSSWGPDLEELGMRYGWPDAWTRLPPRPPETEPDVVGHDRRKPHAFVPTERAFTDPTQATAQDWLLGSTRVARTYYATTYADSFDVLPHQLARFRRGDSSVVVAAYDVSGDSAWAHGPLRAALALATGPDSVLALAVRDDAPARGGLEIRAPAARALVAVELFSVQGRRAARSHYGIAPLAGGAVLSDILLVRADAYGSDATTADLADVVPRALGRAVVHEGESVGLFWETYVTPPPVEDSASLSVSLTIVPAAPSLAQRIAVALRLAERPSPVTLRWDDSGRPAGPAGHVMVLHTTGMPAGRYRLELAVSGVGLAEPAMAVREIEVRAR